MWEDRSDPWLLFVSCIVGLVFPEHDREQYHSKSRGGDVAQWVRTSVYCRSVVVHFNMDIFPTSFLELSSVWSVCLFMWHSDGLESFLGVTPPSPDGFWDWLQLRPQSVECLTVNDQLCRDLFDLYKCWQTKRTNTFHFFLFGKTVILLRIKIKVSNFSELWGQSWRTDRTQRTLAGVSGCALRPLSITP